MSNIFSFLIATDCHLGFEESDHIIGDDSFVTFEEILIKAVELDVDLILLGGDLFHHNNPSQKCMNKCMELLRRYTLGNRPIYFELLSNASEVFSNSVSQTTNYLDENINVSIPVFSIHGNHDDPSGLGQYSALDTLSSAGLVNYFGKWTNLEAVQIKPILLRKGTTKIALYGLSHIKDERLCRLFVEQHVKFIRPEVDANEWFNILVLHQNRVDRGPKRFIAESYIPGFMDLVIWGHEHDCRIEPIQNLEKGFYVIQPGSSVPTSLSEGEALEKHVALLKVYQKKMKIEPLKLNTTRPFVWRSVGLWEADVTCGSREKKSEEIKTYCMQIVEEMIREAKKLLTGHPKQPRLPLIRLRCEYEDETQLFNIVKFGQLFLGRVANPNGEIIRLKRTLGRKAKKDKSEDLARLNELYKEDMEEPCNFSACVNHIVKDYFTNHEEAKMLVLRVNEMGAAVEKFIDKDDLFAIEEFVDRRFDRLMKELTAQKVNADETDIIELFKQLRNEDEKMEVQEEKTLEKKLDKARPKRKEDSPLGVQWRSHAGNGDEVVGIESDDETFGGRNDKKSSAKAVVPDSDTDEYDVDLESSSRRRKDDFSEDSDSDMFGHERVKKASRKTDEGGSKSRGRGRGKTCGRRRAKAPETSRRSPRAQQPKSGSSVVYEDDSD